MSECFDAVVIGATQSRKFPTYTEGYLKAIEALRPISVPLKAARACVMQTRANMLPPSAASRSIRLAAGSSGERPTGTASAGWARSRRLLQVVRLDIRF